MGPVESQTHDNAASAQTMWHSGADDGDLGGPVGTPGNPPPVASQAAVFDLGAWVDLDGAYIWNHNQVNQTERGVDEFEILVSSDTDPLTAAFSSAGTFYLDEAGGTATEPAQYIGFSANQVRLVKFGIMSNQSGVEVDWVGLSEVRLTTTNRLVIMGNLPAADSSFNAQIGDTSSWHRRSAVSFTMADGDPITLGNAELDLAMVFDQGPVAPVVSVQLDAAGAPSGTPLTTLDNPPELEGAAVFLFEDPSGLSLQPLETYWVVVDATGEGRFLWRANSLGETPTSDVGATFGGDASRLDDGAWAPTAGNPDFQFNFSVNTVPEPGLAGALGALATIAWLRIRLSTESRRPERLRASTA